MADSSGNLAYHAIFVQLAKRFANGFQANANYTYSHARDDGPEENGPSPVAQSDPSRRERDRGASWGDVRQTFRLSLVARPKFMVTNEVLSRLVNNNQVSLMAFADSGENFNVVAGFDLNRDGSGGAGPDRPATVGRNAFRLPAFFRVDLRVSRFITLSKDLALEIYGEASNVFNGKYVSSYNGTVLPASNLFTDAVNPITGELRGPIPQFDESQANWRESRQIQLGVRFHF